VLRRTIAPRTIARQHSEFCFEPPALGPEISAGLERDASMKRKVRRRTFGRLAAEQGEQAWQVWHVAYEQDRSTVAQELIADPPRRIVRLQAVNRGEFCLRIAGTSKDLRGLERPDLAAVPDQVRFDAS